MTSDPPGSKRWIWASACRNSTFVSPSASLRERGNGEHRCGEVDADHASVDGDMPEVAARSAGATADVEHVIGATDQVAVEESLPDRRADALEAVGVGSPVLALVTVPGGELLGVGGVDGDGVEGRHGGVPLGSHQVFRDERHTRAVSEHRGWPLPPPLISGASRVGGGFRAWTAPPA